MNAPTSLLVSRALVELAKVDAGSESRDTRVRVLGAEGAAIEGRLFDIDATTLTLVDDATGGFVQVAAGDIRALDVLAPRRRREWALAVLAIVGSTLALAGYAMLPWVRPRHGGDIVLGFIVLYLAVTPLFSMLMRYTGLGNWLTRWRPLYPPPGDR